MNLDLTSLRSAVSSLEAALAQEKNEFIRDSVIQRFEYHTARNITSHSYNVSVAEQVYQVAARFIIDAQFLLRNLSAIHG